MAIDQVIARLRRALMLDPTAFEEARDDVAFTPMALAAAAIAVFLGGIGSFLWAAIILDSTGDIFVEATILGSIFLILLMLAGIAIGYVVLTQIYKEDVAPDALARVMAIGHIPFALSFLVFIPGLGFAFGMLAVALMFFYTIFGIRAAFPNIKPLRVLISVLAAFAVWAMILPLLTSPSDAFAPGVFVFEISEDAFEDFFSISSIDFNLEDIFDTE
ncbi:MAG: hypothetical protein IH957_02270 [Chloroflexi bacterium]|nr:hypothetical protein [Chloroflexota bacterium]